MLRLEQVVTEAGEHPVDLAVAAGDGVTLIGPSGGTRSRLLAAAAGLLEPHAGRVVLDGEPVLPVQVGFVDEDRSVIGALTAVENVASRALLRGGSGVVDTTAIAALLGRLGLPESSWHNLAEQLSGGQQQRVAIARALFGAPALLCLDDPVSELDEASAALIWQVIADAVRDGAILLVGLPEPDDRAPTSTTRSFLAGVSGSGSNVDIVP